MANAVETPERSSGERWPALVIMVGAPGSGKSYLARMLGAALGAVLIQTDVVRKELYPDPQYTAAEHTAVYAACHQRIREALARGERVVFDATNLRERRRRTLYQMAERADAIVEIVVAYASDAVIRERLRGRAEGVDPEDRSDADLGVYLRMRRDTEPVPRPHVVVNTSAAPGPAIRLLERQLSERPAGPVERPAQRGEGRRREPRAKPHA